MLEMPFRVVHPWGPNQGRQATLIIEHATLDEAFAEIDRLAAELVRTGAPSDAVELLVVGRQRGTDRGPAWVTLSVRGRNPTVPRLTAPAAMPNRVLTLVQRSRAEREGQ